MKPIKILVATPKEAKIVVIYSDDTMEIKVKLEDAPEADGIEARLIALDEAGYIGGVQ